MVGIWGIFRNFVDDMKQGLLFCATWIAGAGVLVRLSSTMMGSPWLTVISDSLMILGGFVAALMGAAFSLRRPQGCALTGADWGCGA